MFVAIPRWYQSQEETHPYPCGVHCIRSTLDEVDASIKNFAAALEKTDRSNDYLLSPEESRPDRFKNYYRFDIHNSQGKQVKQLWLYRRRKNRRNERG